MLMCRSTYQTLAHAGHQTEFAEILDAALGGSSLRLANFCCSASFQNWPHPSWVLLTFNFALNSCFLSQQGLMILLQNLPTMHWGNEEVSVLLAEAYRLKFAFADAPNHYKR